MALISCKTCGKKYSDTVATCIHCGASNPAFASSAHQSDSQTKKAKDTDSTSKATSYYVLSYEYHLELESEYLSQHEVALKQEQRVRTNAMLRDACGHCLLIALALLLFLWFCSHWIANIFFLSVTLCWIVLLVSFGLIGGTVFLIRGIVLFFSANTKNAPEQTFKEWLETEKHISFDVDE